MDNFVYKSLCGYFHALETSGYLKQKNVESLLVLLFYYNYMFHDYRGYVSREDYRTIEKALNCLYGTNCLIPYPDYLKMRKLCLGEIAELAARVKVVEKGYDEFDQRIEDNTQDISTHTEELGDHESRLVAIENTKVVKGNTQVTEIADIVIPA